HVWTAPFDARGEHRTGETNTAIREQVRARVADRDETGGPQLEETYFLRRTESVLERAQDANPGRDIAFELQHDVDEMLGDARSGDDAFLRHVSDENDRRAAIARRAHEPRAALADLRYRARCRRDVRVEDGLY